MSARENMVERLRLDNADDIAVLLEEHLRCDDGYIEGVPYVAVKIAEEYEAEIRRINAIGEIARQLAEQAHQDYQNMMRDRDGLRDEARALKQYLSAEREFNRQLAAERDRLRKELEAVNNEFGSQTADWPEAWTRVAKLKQINGERWQRIEQLKALLARAIGYEPQLDTEIRAAIGEKA
ncbi:hypothetical protein [Microvirga mediterraneensis]|uniref:Uncharacterized protein n=1 Tax=Microvirga mediterraneensis TaxID=2754695 RepID=A0A838BS68_9HYPH|nr:hypothetical protein [Microvirga mediterraneensis]MBA1157753.1 hypothetical protein [Microvirga mediterraneensis]